MPPAADVLAQRARRQVANAADWRRRNPGRDKELRRSYYQRHKDAYRGYVLTRRARQVAAPVNDFTGEQWQELLVEHASTCAYCLAHGVPLEADHSVPLSRGGSHTKANIVPACRSCNSRKGDKTPTEFFAWLQARRQAAAA